MRFSRIDLTAFGHFTDRSLTFGDADHDLHLVIGPNEAGKSTTLLAISEMLYGIHGQTSFDFVHDKSDMRIGAVIEANGEEHHWVRRKGNRNTLLDSNDQAVDENALKRLLGQIERDGFDHMFSLNTDRLVAGAKDLLDPGSDAGSALFEAASGLSSLAELRKALSDEAGELVGRGNKKALNSAKNRLKEAASELRESTTTATNFKQVRKALTDAEGAQAEADADYSDAKVRHAKLRRVRSVRNLIGKIDKLAAELEDIGETPTFPDDAATLLDSAERELTTLRVQLSQRRGDSKTAQSAMDQCAPPDKILEQEPAIVSLYEAVQQARSVPRDLAKLKTQLGQSEAAQCGDARQISWGELDAAAVQAKLPTALQIRALQSYLGKRQSLENALALAQTAERKSLAAVKQTNTRLEGVQGQAIDPAVTTAVINAKKALALADQAKQAETDASDAGAELERAINHLPHYGGSGEGLRGIPLPSRERVTQMVAEHRNLKHGLEIAQASLAENADKIDAVKSNLRLAEASGDVATREDVIAARVARDVVWEAIKSDGGVAARQQPFETAIEKADDNADQYAGHAEEAALLSQQRHQLEALDSIATKLTEQMVVHGKELTAFEKNWNELVTKAGVQGVHWDDYVDWLDRYRTAVDALDRLEEAQRRTKTTSANERQLFEELSALAIAQSIGGNERAASLADLVDVTDQAIDRALKKAAQAETITEQLTDAQRDLESTSEAAAIARSDLSQWRSELPERLKASSIADDAPIEIITETSGVLVDMVQRQEVIDRDRKNRLNPMQETLDQVADEAQRLADMVGIDGGAAQPIAWGDALYAAVTEARAAADTYAKAQQTVASAADKVVKIEEAITIQMRQLQRLHVLAGIEDNDEQELRDSVNRWKRRHEVQDALAEVRARVEELADGFKLEALREQCAEFDPESFESELHDAGVAEVRSVEKTRECDKAFTEAQQAYAAIDTSGRAMIAETKRQQSMADIASAAASYIRVQTAYRLLSSGLEQFRAQHQGPLLRSASTFFHDITGGRYNELSVDYETSELRAKDQSGYKKPQALSEGTRNQLYLALRLAALTQQLAAGTQLPFIADDLLITFDEERAGNALKGLHRLSEQTQVIYFTHQAEIERIAQSVLGSSVNIIRL
ncbi:MAG: hypothetical protein ACI89J_003826 [Hyphomicrobiaceae bacterium]|jgi:uncharacterized protein YhaN